MSWSYLINEESFGAKSPTTILVVQIWTFLLYDFILQAVLDHLTYYLDIETTTRDNLVWKFEYSAKVRCLQVFNYIYKHRKQGEASVTWASRTSYWLRYFVLREGPFVFLNRYTYELWFICRVRQTDEDEVGFFYLWEIGFFYNFFVPGSLQYELSSACGLGWLRESFGKEWHFVSNLFQVSSSRQCSSKAIFIIVWLELT